MSRTAVFLLACLLADSALGQANEYIYVSSRNTNSVKRFRADNGAYVDDFVSSGSGGLVNTQEVLWGPDGHLYVTGIGNRTVKKYDGTTGEFLGDFTNGYSLDRPTKTSFGPDGHLYVSQWGSSHPQVARFDGSTGTFIDEVTANPTDIDPMAHAWDDQGRLHVVNFTSRDVRRYDSEGDGEVIIDGLSGPVNLWFGDNNTIWVVDWGTNAPGFGRVKLYDAGTGLLRRTLIQGLQHAEGWAVGPADGYLYVCDWTADVVNRYDMVSGDLVDTFINTGGLNAPNSITFGPPASATGVETDEIPGQTRLTGTFPNPFTDRARGILELASPGSVTVEVVDLLGRIVAGPVSRDYPAGTHTLEVSVGDVPAGTYLYRVEAGGQVVSRVLIKTE